MTEMNLKHLQFYVHLVHTTRNISNFGYVITFMRTFKYNFFSIFVLCELCFNKIFK